MSSEPRRAELSPTVSQTVGPYFHIGLRWLFDDSVAAPGARGTHIVVAGRVLDGDGEPVPDALLEVWQADAQGHYVSAKEAGAAGSESNADFKGYARIPTDDDGSFRFSTVKPGPVATLAGQPQAPHIMVAVFMRGLLRQVATRIYFADERANESDPVLERVPPARRNTLLARPRAEQPNVYDWNVVLQGPEETVFFDL
jgi:protocatechuate 3,4-dioxygenase, alpha subunit